MKFRLPFQIYRTGVISRSNSPGKVLTKFCKDNDAKVRKKTSYRSIISNFIYSFTHLPLKITMSKLRNRTKLRMQGKSRKVNIRNEFVYLQETLKHNFSHKKNRSYKVTNETSECYMNSTKCANFLCAKSTAKILLRQKDLLCNKKSEKTVTPKKKEVKSEERTQSNNLKTSTNRELEKGTTNITPPAATKIDKPVEMPVKEKHKPNEYKWKFHESEEVDSNSEIKRLKTLLQSYVESKNIKEEVDLPLPRRMDTVMGTPLFPKKLPELPVQIVPRNEHDRPKEPSCLIAPKRKYDAPPDISRNYKSIETVYHIPQRMDDLVGCNAEPMVTNSDIKALHEDYKQNSKVIDNKSNPVMEVRHDTTKNRKHFLSQQDLSLKSSPNKNTVVDKHDTIGKEKDAFLLKLDQVIHDLIPKTNKVTKNLQELKTANINVTERIKKYEELIVNNSNKRRSSSKEMKSKLMEEKLILRGKQTQNREYGILSPELSPFAMAEIRRKYYPSNAFEKDKTKLAIPLNALVVESDAKLKHLHSTPNGHYKKLDQRIHKNNSGDSMKKKHAKVRNSITKSVVEKQKDLFAVNVDKNNGGSVACSETSMPITISQKISIPPPKGSKAPLNKRNYSSTSIYEYSETFGVCTKLLNNPIDSVYTKAISNICNTIPPAERKYTACIKKYGDVNSEMPRANNFIRLESSKMLQDIDNLKQDRRFSTDVLATNLKNQNNHTRELDTSFMTKSNMNMDHTLQSSLSKRRCTIQVTSTNDNEDNADNAVSSVGGLDKSTRKLSYQYYHEQCTISKSVNNLPANYLNDQNSATLVINAADLITTEKCNNMLTDPTELVGNYIKTQLQKIVSTTKKSNKEPKCCLNFMTRIDKQNKYRMTKYKIIRMKQSNLSSKNLAIRKEKNESFNNTVKIIKSQVAHKCILFDKISYALLKKTDTISNINQMNMRQTEQKITDFRHTQKLKLSRVPILNKPPKTKIIPTPELIEKKKEVLMIAEPKKKFHVPEWKHVAPVQQTRYVEHMDVDMPPLNEKIAGVQVSKVREETCNRRKHSYSFKLKPPSRETTRSEAIPPNRKCFRQHILKIKPPAIPATMKAKRFLAKIEAEKQMGNLLTNKIDKKVKRQKSIKIPN